MILDFFIKNPTVPLVSISAIVAYLSWKSQQRLTRAKHSIDLQNNYLSSEKILNSMYEVAQMSKILSSDEIKNLSEINSASECDPKDKERLEHLRTVLNALERTAIGIKRNIYDTDLLYDSYASYVIDTYTSFQSYIIEKQKGNENFYKNYVWLAMDWKSKRDGGEK